MVLRVFNGGLFSPQLDFRVGRFIRAHGTFQVRQIGNVHQQGGELGCIFLRDTVQFPDAGPRFPRTRASIEDVSSPFFLSMPICLEVALRSDCKACFFRFGIAARLIAGQNVINKLPRVAAAGL